MANSQQTDLPSYRRRKQARPGELLSAALDLFVERGFAATRLEDIASRAGVSKGTLYLYYTSKEELFREVISQGILPVLDQGETMLAEHRGDARSLLKAMLGRWWQLIGSTNLGGITKLMICESGNFPEVGRFYHDNVIVRGRSLIRRVLELGNATGEFRHADMDSATDVILAPLLMLTIWRFSLGPCVATPHDAESYLNTHVQLLLNGLLAGERKV
jgi:AcrR family transcriptional regulator